MFLNLILVTCLQMTMILSAPLHFPLLQPIQGTLEQQQLALQEQMFALQQFQALQSLKIMPPVTNLNNLPILVVIPNADTETKLKHRIHPEYNHNNNEADHDSIIIDAGNDFEDVPNDGKGIKAVLLVPNARGIIGNIISGIPFFPIEINVPDSIAFIYKWFSDLIAGWGSQASSTRDVQSILKNLRTRQEKPIIMIPFNSPYFK